MAAKKYPMMRYPFTSSTVEASMQVCIEQFKKRYGYTPKFGHVHPSAITGPTQIDGTQVFRAWGLQPHEIDLGPVEDKPAEIQSVPQLELQSASPDTEPAQS
jgi:hypothetical protein